MTKLSSSARRLSDLTSAEVPQSLQGATIVWAFGSVEQHGPHLPLSVDLDIADAFATATAARLEHSFVAPPQAFGARSLPGSGGGLAFPGTLYLRGGVLIEYLQGLIAGFATLGCKQLVIINGHYENEAFLLEAIDSTREAGELGTCAVTAFSWWSLVEQTWLDRHIGKRFPGWHAEHAGLTETSLMLHLKPDLVGLERPEHPTPPPAGIYVHPVDLPKTTTDGVLSSTACSTAELGRALFEHVVERILQQISYSQK